MSQTGVLITSHEEAEMKKDRFCWNCHFEKVDMFCGNCPRAFHTECIASLEHYPAPEKHTSKKLKDGNKLLVLGLNKCQECIVAEETSLESLKHLGACKTKTILKACCRSWIKCINSKNENKILDAKKYEEDYNTYVETVARVVDLKKLEQLVETDVVKTFEGLAGELKWIYHNSTFFNGQLDNETKISKTFQNVCFEQLNNIVMSCMDCQYILATPPDKRQTNFFMELCKLPHPVAWVKLPGYPYWPAKIIYGDESYVEAFFFDDHSRAFVKPGDCIQYSKNQPIFNNKKHLQRHQARLKKAISEADNYLSVLAESEDIGPMTMAENAKNPWEAMTSDFVSALFPKMGEEIADQFVTTPAVFKLI